MKVGDLVQLIGSHGEGPEVTAVIGTVLGPWRVDEWWEVLVDGRVIHWPESQMGLL
mgnify:FL=1